jgi:hypothetical protein
MSYTALEARAGARIGTKERVAMTNPWHSVDGGGNEPTATTNMHAFVTETVPGASVVRCAERDYDASYGDGRFAFLVRHNGRQCEIQMPGLPLDCVRFLGAEWQSAWGFPRLYVDGNSWLWCFAAEAARCALGLGDDASETKELSR